MVTYNVIDPNVNGAQTPYIEGACLSTDAKPTGVANGSKMLEMDTGKLYAFDEANSTWREI